MRVESLPVARLARGTDRTRRDSNSASHTLLVTAHTDHPDGSLPAHRRGALRGRMPRKSLHGRTCSVSRDGGRAGALQPNRNRPLYCRPSRAQKRLGRETT
ncbi:hypothetical protein XaplCFBP3123_03165 [Xanthomonas arboricola pv. populi]|nr:hypothetical protein XaplCFBP3123_03165 [Xanthomonas arboricola pv. populi]